MSDTLSYSPSQIRRRVHLLRSDAYFAYLDGRNAFARKLNKEADRLERQLRDMEDK